MNHYDVIVIGLGPSGSMAALMLESYGIKFLCIDKEKEIEDFKEKLRLNFMIDTIGRLEEVTIDREAVAGEFIQMAMMFNQSADELIKTPYGSRLYNQILSRRQEESSLDRVVARVFGDPIEIEEDKTKKETVAESNISE